MIMNYVLSYQTGLKLRPLRGNPKPKEATSDRLDIGKMYRALRVYGIEVL